MGKTPPPPGVRRSLNALSNNAVKPLFGTNRFVEYMVGLVLAPELNKAENVAQQQKLYTVGRHENYAKREQRSFVR